MKSYSPGLRSYPGWTNHKYINPERVESSRATPGCNPVGVEFHLEREPSVAFGNAGLNDFNPFGIAGNASHQFARKIPVRPIPPLVWPKTRRAWLLLPLVAPKSDEGGWEEAGLRESEQTKSASAVGAKSL
jgi:hypothetical protein